MALNQGVTYIRLEGDLTPLQRDLKSAEVMTTRTGTRVESRFKRVGSSIASSLGTAAKRGAQAAGLAAVAWAGYSVKAASDVGESINKASVIFGKGIDKVLEWSETTANAFGISQAEALETSASFGAMLETAGITGDAMTEMSMSLVELASDMGSFNNQDPSEMLDRLRSGLAGEAEPLRRFGVFISEAAIQTQALKDGLIEQGEEMTEAQKVQARYNLILAQTTKQQGDFGRTSESMPNQLRILKASFADVSAELGNKLLPVAVKVLEWLNENLPAAIEFVSRVIRGWSNLWDATIEAIGHSIAEIINIFQEFLRIFINVAGGIVDAAAFAFGWLPGIGSKIRRFQAQFHETTEAILADLEDQITRFENWGKTSIWELGKTNRQARILGNTILDITTAIQSLARISIPGGLFTAPSGPGLGDGLGVGGGLASQWANAAITAVPGPQWVSSGYRPGSITSSGNVSLHADSSNPAQDISGPLSNGVFIDGVAVASYLAAHYGSSIRELIHTPLGWGIKNGKKVGLDYWGSTVNADHYDHVHVADMGAIIRGPAMIAQGNITEAHIPLTGPGSTGMFLTGVLEIPGLGKAILKSAHLTFDQREHQSARSGRWQASVAT